MTTNTPTPASMEAAIVALCICAARGEEPSSDAYRHSEICPARGAGVVHRTARALDAAESRGYRKGMEEAAAECDSHAAEMGEHRGIILSLKNWGPKVRKQRAASDAASRECEAICCAEAIRSRLSERGEGG